MFGTASRHLPARQRGAALLILLALVTVVITYTIVAGLNRSAGDLTRARDQKTYAALAQAKEALIGYAATYHINLDTYQPGALPCPDRNEPGNSAEGTASSPCTSSASLRIGRLPWKTLGLPDLRDASGERLWYALSANFVNAPTSTVVNSDNFGDLFFNLSVKPPPSSSYTATSLANSIVAIVFAPGAVANAQNRDPTNITALKSVSNYLEGKNGDVANDDLFETGPASASFNDTLLAVSHSDLFSVVENMVANKIETDVKPFITAYVAALPSGARYYPFAVPFTSPSTTINDYKGTSTTTDGLLPVTLDPNFLTWKTPLATDVMVQVTGTATAATGEILSQDCSYTTSTVFTCYITYRKISGSVNYQPYISVTARLQNVGMAFVEYNQIIFSSTCSGCSRVITQPSLNTKTIRADGDMDLLFGGTSATNGLLQSTSNTTTGRTAILHINWSGSPSQYTVRPTAANWFFDNEWYRLTYYAVSSGYGPTQISPCPPATACLTVNNMAPPNGNIGALLVFAGRAGKKSNGTDQARPSSLLPDYFEGENLTPADRIFESNTRSNTFNDKIVVLAP